MSVTTIKLNELDWMEVFQPQGSVLFFKNAFQHIRHPACPVLTAILKAVEVEVGLALPRDAFIWFEPTDS